MWTRTSYFARETMVSLRRNVLMTVAGIATVAVSLSLFGGILMLSKWVDHGTEKLKGGVTLEIFMKVDATEQQIDDVESNLNDLMKPGGTVAVVPPPRQDRRLRGVQADLPPRARPRQHDQRGRPARVVPGRAAADERWARHRPAHRRPAAGVPEPAGRQERQHARLTRSRASSTSPTRCGGSSSSSPRSCCCRRCSSS